jgi:hypothetical protein
VLRTAAQINPKRDQVSSSAMGRGETQFLAVTGNSAGGTYVLPEES